MLTLVEAGIEEGSEDISSALAGPCFAANAPYMEVSESIVCLQLRFQFDVSAPLTQQRLPAKSDLENCYSFDLVFSSDTSMYRFTGKPVSQTTGLYYYGARWYDPTTGRFISQDPFAGRLSDPQSLNPYIYVQDSPTSSVDPTGMADCGWGNIWGCIENGGSGAWNGITTAGSDIANAWNSQPTWAKYTEIGVAAGAAIILTAGIAAPEVLVLVPPLLVGDVGFGAGAAGVCEEDPEACDPIPPPVTSDTNPAGLCECPTLPTGGEGVTPVNPVDTSSFFSRTDLSAGTIDSNTIAGLSNGVPVPSSSVSGLIREWVGSNAESGPSGTGARYFSEPSPGVTMQARVDYGQIGSVQGVFRLVLERYVDSGIRFKVHLPIIG